MKKSEATLLDLCVRETLSKHRLIPAEYRSKLLAARKFVLSEDMSAYLADLTCGPFAELYHTCPKSAPKGSKDAALIRKRNQRALELLENARHLANAPHALTWIEYDVIARRRRTHEAYSDFLHSTSGKLAPENEVCPRVGWLIEQHAGLPTAFRVTELFEYVDGHAGIMPFSMAYLTDDESGLPWKSIDCPMGKPSQIFTGLPIYKSDRVAMLASQTELPDNETTSLLLNEIAGGLRAVWCLLATLNDIPVSFNTIRPVKGYVAKGQYHRFSEHSIIGLAVPGHRSLKTIAMRALSNLRRRAHQVRGHWRDDHWHLPISQCPHDWISDGPHAIKCKSCGGRRFWIAEHSRGDASLGFVLHDYAVGRGKMENAGKAP